MDNKPWYEKIGIWIGIISGIFAILGISVFGSKSLIKDESEEAFFKEESKSLEEELVPSTIPNNENDSLKQTEELNSQEQEESDSINEEKNADNKETNVEHEERNNKTITPFVTSTPKADTVTNVHLYNWDDDDRDIFSNHYTGSNTFKLSVYNMIYAMGGGADNITAEVHFPLGGNFDDIWLIDFLVMQDMLGNGSYANVTILSGEEELYPTFVIASDTTDEYKYEVNLSGIRDLILRFECYAVDSGFYGGIIINEKVEQ